MRCSKMARASRESTNHLRRNCAHHTLFGRGYACLLRLKLVGLYEAKFDALCLTPLRERIDDQLRATATVNCFRAPVYSMSCSWDQSLIFRCGRKLRHSGNLITPHCFYPRDFTFP